MEPEDKVSIGDFSFPEPKIMPKGTFGQGLRCGFAAAIDPIGLCFEGFPEEIEKEVPGTNFTYTSVESRGIHENSITTIAEKFIKDDPRNLDIGRDMGLGMATGIGLSLCLHLMTSGVIPITAGIIDGAIYLGEKIKT